MEASEQSLVKEKYKELFNLNEQAVNLIHNLWDKNPIKISNLLEGLAAAYLGKCYKTHRATLLLCKDGFGEDALILCRGMFHLIVNFLYIQKDDTGQRVTRYMDYEWVVRRDTLEAVKQGNPVNDYIRKRLAEEAEVVKEIYENAVKVEQKWGYERRLAWSDKSIEGMANEVGLGYQYKTIYAHFCQIDHAGPLNTNDFVKDDGEEGFIIASGPSEQFVDQALLFAFQVIFQMTEAWAKVFKVDIRRELEMLTDELEKVVAKE
ncbi:MAG TPA: DUF5677 domain-containing protein [Patescibacteria group bacterium]|nr:DUF5677 domain-containing protein [Patescibacteria group bacterium]